MEVGKRFSLLYLDRSKTLRDSTRFRNRLAAFLFILLDILLLWLMIIFPGIVLWLPGLIDKA